MVRIATKIVKIVTRMVIIVTRIVRGLSNHIQETFGNINRQYFYIHETCRLYIQVSLMKHRKQLQTSKIVHRFLLNI